jgi:hypothetical protein
VPGTAARQAGSTGWTKSPSAMLSRCGWWDWRIEAGFEASGVARRAGFPPVVCERSAVGIPLPRGEGWPSEAEAGVGVSHGSARTSRLGKQPPPDRPSAGHPPTRGRERKSSLVQTSDSIFQTAMTMSLMVRDSATPDREGLTSYQRSRPQLGSIAQRCVSKDGQRQHP